jgi:cysteinyl-tRNA synthetase
VEIVELAERRLLAKKAKDFTGADILRSEIINKGWEIKDTKDGYELNKI